MWPQITIIVFFAIIGTNALINHGKPKPGNFSFWLYLVNMSIWNICLYYGGFYDVFNK